MLVLFKMNLQDFTLFEWFGSAFSSGLEGKISKIKIKISLYWTPQ